MSKSAPPAKVAPSKTAPKAAPAPKPEAPPRVWSDLAIAAQVEVAKDGSVLDPFTKTPIAKDVGGILDVRRPGREDMPKPTNVKVVGSVAESFAKWYMDTCYIAPVTEAEAQERLGEKDFTLPDIAVDVKETPLAFVTAKLGDEDYAFVVINGQICRVGKRTERSYLWAYSDALIKARGEKMCPKFTRSENSDEAFKVIMHSFNGKFRVGNEPAAAPKAAKKAAPAKAAPKSTPKRVPAKK